MSLIPTKQKWNQYTTSNKWALLAAITTVIFLIYDHWPQSNNSSTLELIAKDENPVKLEIADISIKQWLGDSEPYITVNIKNASKRSAINVLATFQGEKDSWQFTPTKTATQFQSGVSIPAQSSLEFPIAPISEFLLRMPNSQKLHFVGLGVNPNIPFSYSQKECQNLNPCQLQMEAKPVGFNLNYKNIFNEPVHQFFSVFTYFSSKSVTRKSPISITIIEPQASGIAD